MKSRDRGWRRGLFSLGRKDGGRGTGRPVSRGLDVRTMEREEYSGWCRFVLSDVFGGFFWDFAGVAVLVQRLDLIERERERGREGIPSVCSIFRFERCCLL